MTLDYAKAEPMERELEHNWQVVGLLFTVVAAILSTPWLVLW